MVEFSLLLLEILEGGCFLPLASTVDNTHEMLCAKRTQISVQLMIPVLFVYYQRINQFDTFS
jgi:hypothetical protein